jgi:hypothetical protein
MSLIDALVYVALNRAAGLSYGATKEAFLDLLHLSDDPAKASAMGAVQSCCGTTVRGEMAAAGVDGRLTIAGKDRDVLLDAYDTIGVDVFTALETLAMHHGAWRGHPTDGDLLQPGTVVIVTGPDHMFVVTDRSVSADGTVTIFTVEGGQDDSLTHLDTAILKKQHVIQHGAGGILVLSGRPCFGCFAVDDLPARPDAP